MCDMTFNAFADILDIICSFPYLQSVALDESTVESSSVEKSTRIRVKNKVLPSSVNSVRCRGGQGCLRAFMLWLLHHNNVPKLANLDVGPIEEEITFEVEKYLTFAGPAINHLSLSFNFNHNYTHLPALQYHDPQIMLVAENAEIVSPIAERYKTLFGLDACPYLGPLTGLQSLRLNDFTHFEDHIQVNSLVWVSKIVASIEAEELREVILGVSLRNAGELDKFNIRWHFLDEAFSNIMDSPYSSLVTVKFEINGTVNIDGIASLIRSRLPGCEKRGLLQFCREKVY